MNPYHALPPASFWRKCAATADFGRDALYQPKVAIGAETRVATMGSCFAQHIGTFLGQSNATLLDMEPAPPGMSAESAKTFGYGLFSARYGNVYSARQFRELIEDAISGTVHAEAIWQKNGRAYDALRPGVEPNGLADAE